MKSLSERFPKVIFVDEDRIEIGKNVMIQPGTIIGAIPMMTHIENLKEDFIPIEGKIIIEDDVKIGCGVTINFGCGSNNQISKGVMGRNTVIKKGAFIWHKANIGHDVIIGEHTKIGAYTCIAGGCTIGYWSYIAMHVTVQPLRKIGNFTMIGSKALVTKDFGNEIIAYGIPAKYERDNLWKPDGWVEHGLYEG